MGHTHTYNVDSSSAAFIVVDNTAQRYPRRKQPYTTTIYSTRTDHLPNVKVVYKRTPTPKHHLYQTRKPERIISTDDHVRSPRPRQLRGRTVLQARGYYRRGGLWGRQVSLLHPYTNTTTTAYDPAVRSRPLSSHISIPSSSRPSSILTSLSLTHPRTPEPQSTSPQAPKWPSNVSPPLNTPCSV